MASLSDQTAKEKPALFVERAEGLNQRIRGLLGRSDLPEGHALWIRPCPAIHTFFMQFSIDVIFADKNLKVVSVFHCVPPGRILFGGWKSHSVFELKANQLKNFNTVRGNQLYVGR